MCVEMLSCGKASWLCIIQVLHIVARLLHLDASATIWSCFIAFNFATLTLKVVETDLAMWSYVLSTWVHDPNQLMRCPSSGDSNSRDNWEKALF